jgi:hypothetical protein
MAHCTILRMIETANYVGMGLLLLIVLLQAGCKRSTTVVGPDGQKVTVSKNGEDTEVAFKGINGQEVHYAGGKKNVALPADFPADIVYPKATVALSSTANEVMMVVLKSADPLEKAKTFYDETLKKSGWKIENTLNTPAGTMVQGTKEGRTLTVLISTESDQTSIQLSVTKKDK